MIQITNTHETGFKDFISGSSVALVGPAKYMHGSGYGPEIESHDIVVRINRGIETALVYKNDVGSRTDVLYSCLIERAQQAGKLDRTELKEKHKIQIIVAPPVSDYAGHSKGTHFHGLIDVKKAEFISELIPIRIIDHNFNNKISDAVKCKPNTGFLSIYDLLEMNPSKLSIYGFSFYLDGFIPGQKSGVENEKNCSEQEFADMAFASKRHIQKNMWEYAKETLLDNEVVNLDKTLKMILEMQRFSKEDFKRVSNENFYTD